jgi:hypothetical protein
MILVILVVTSLPSSHVWIHVIKYFITCPRYKNIYQTDESNLYGCQWVEPLPDGLISTYIPYVKIKGNMKGYGWSSSRRVLSTTLRPLLWVTPDSIGRGIWRCDNEKYMKGTSGLWIYGCSCYVRLSGRVMFLLSPKYMGIDYVIQRRSLRIYHHAEVQWHIFFIITSSFDSFQSWIRRTEWFLSILSKNVVVRSFVILFFCTFVPYIFFSFLFSV